MTKADIVKIVQAAGILASGFVLIFTNTYFITEAFLARCEKKLY